MRSINQRHFRSIDASRLQELAGRNTRTFQIIILVELDASVGNHFVDFLRSVEIDNFVGDMAVNNLDIWCLDEAIFVNPRISRQVQHQTDVSALWRLDRADSSVMCRVSITHLKAGTLATQAAWPHRAQSALVAEFRNRVDLVEQLAELARSKEFAHRCHDRAGVYQLAWRNILEIRH